MAASDPLISIVIPAYNVSAFLPATLESIQGQSETRWEVVIVDDGSRDGTAQVAESFARANGRIHLVRQANAGAAAARNTGYRATDPSSRYLTFMDGDDVWLPGALATLLERLENAPAAVGSHGLADFIDEEDQLDHTGAHATFGRNRFGRKGARLVRLDLDEPTDFEVLINSNTLFPPGLMLARRSAYESAGPFDTDFNGPEDWDMLIRLSRFGPIEFIDEVILHYRRHRNNLGAQPGIAEQAWKVRCKAFHSEANSPEQRRSARIGWRAYQKQRISDVWHEARASARQGDVTSVARDLARIAVFGGRYLRGYPTPRICSEPLRW